MGVLKTLRANDKSDHIVLVEDDCAGDRFSWSALAKFIGPGFLVSIAYIDPGNFLTDIQAGARFNYMLLWVIVLSTFLGLVLQVLSARLGIVTHAHLATMCRLEYGHRTPLTIALWLLTELAIICSDIPEVIGSAYAMLLLFKLPLWVGVLVTSTSTMALLGMQYFGVRTLELFIGLLVLLMGACFFVEAGLAPIAWGGAECPADWCSHFAPPPNGTDAGASASPGDDWCPPDYCMNFWRGFAPVIKADALAVAVGLLGAVVMPHNLYLHSGLMGSRHVDTSSPVQVKWAIRYNVIESSLSLLVSCAINVAVLAVAAAVFYPSANNGYRVVEGVEDVGFEDAEQLLSDSLKRAAGKIFGISLLASGISSTITGTYAGQFVMEGFLDLRMAKWKRNLLTRSVAIVPSLVVAVVSGPGGANLLIIVSSIVLSFQLPFAMIPLIKFTNQKRLMGSRANKPAMKVLCTLLAAVVIGANVALIVTTIFGSDMSSAMLALAGVLVGTGFLLYFALLLWLIRRPVRMEWPAAAAAAAAVAAAAAAAAPPRAVPQDPEPSPKRAKLSVAV